MEFNEYQQLAERTARKANDTPEKRFINFSFGLTGETGEVIDCIKKHLFHGHPLDQEKLKIELGDVLWYIATLATTAGLTLHEIAVTNIEKLKVRYPEGFSEERSIYRKGDVDCRHCKHYISGKMWCIKHNDGRLPDEECSDGEGGIT